MCRRKRKHSPEAIEAGGEAGPVYPLSDLYAVLEGSALVPFLESKLQVRVVLNGKRYIDEVLHVVPQASSFLEIGWHSAVYRVSSGRCPDRTTWRARANGSVPKPEKAGHTPGKGGRWLNDSCLL